MKKKGMEKTLHLILDKLQSLESGQKQINQRLDLLESGQKELQQITKAILDCQEETDARLEALSSDIQSVYGEVKEIKDTMATKKELIQSEERLDAQTLLIGKAQERI
ncbi:hypothetical protein HMPREF0083_06032 [Aneurinibacillus aneurinilyticus ATCC 12856]|uniref:Uncharacterized protein n=1 Tax=Aneurinibacillus aneurinilyticus ATCC 12856 TaxID=649747 RepID=U1WPG1_ANEAE|nr:hypothetical protein HMPREF0083_06032 [Aneurinibacillus aneurinilyticus ATCC 12856]